MNRIGNSLDYHDEKQGQLVFVEPGMVMNTFNPSAQVVQAEETIVQGQLRYMVRPYKKKISIF
jgi:hypothetical protein